MTGDQHYKRAEEDIDLANKSSEDGEQEFYLRRATIHAQLAHAIWQKAMADAVAERYS